MAHVHLDRERNRNLGAAVLDPVPAGVRHAGHVDEQVVGSDPDVVVDAAGTRGEVVQDRADAERRQDVRRDLDVELATDPPGLAVGRLPEIDLAAHDEADERIGRQDARQARRILRILVPRNIAGAFEVAQHGAAAGIAKSLDDRIGVLL